MAPTDKPQSHGPALAAASFDTSENDLVIGGLAVRDIVAEAADFAQHDAEPAPSELWTDVLL